MRGLQISGAIKSPPNKNTTVEFLIESMNLLPKPNLFDLTRMVLIAVNKIKASRPNNLSLQLYFPKADNLNDVISSGKERQMSASGWQNSLANYLCILLTLISYIVYFFDFWSIEEFACLGFPFFDGASGSIDPILQQGILFDKFG